MIDVLNWTTESFGHTLTVFIMLALFRPVRVIINLRKSGNE